MLPPSSGRPRASAQDLFGTGLVMCPPLPVPALSMPVNFKRREWSVADESTHSDACKNKGRLSLADRLQIIGLHKEVPLDKRKSQKQLADIFRTSRVTICKILQKESVAKIKALAASGMSLRTRRMGTSRHLEFEQALLQQLGNDAHLMTRREIFVQATALSKIADVTIDHKWCSRFMKRYDLANCQHHQKGDLTAVDMVNVNTETIHSTMATKPMYPLILQGGRLGFQPSPAFAQVAGRAMDKAASEKLYSPMMCKINRTVPATHDDDIAIQNMVWHYHHQRHRLLGH